MPFAGGFSPQPERTGGGAGTSAAPILQRVFESIAASRGRAFDQTTGSVVGAENMALARAITFDLYGANDRFANEMNPAYATVAGLLPRWEKILGQPPLPGDQQSVRQARCAAALARFGRPNTYQPVIDAVRAVLGNLFVGLTLFGPSNALTWWPGYGGSAAQVTTVSGNLVTVAGLANVPTNAAGSQLVVSNASNPGNDGTFSIHSYVSASSVIVVNNGSPVAADNGFGGTLLAPTIAWAMPNSTTPWTSTIAHVDILVNPTLAIGLLNTDGTVNGKFWALVNLVNPVLDLMLPADCTFDWYVLSSHGVIGFFLDEPDLDLEAFD
jgi:hypothetical protein